MKKLTLVLCMLLIATTVVAKEWHLKWDAVSGDVDGYVVYYSDNVGGSFQKDVNTGTEISLNDLNVAVGIPYVYNVTAYNHVGESAWSNPVDFTRPEFIPGEGNLPTIVITIPNGVSTITINRAE